MRIAAALALLVVLQDPTPRQQFAEKREALKGSTDPAAYADLGEWCAKQSLKDDARWCFQRAWEFQEGFDRAKAGMASIGYDLDGKLFRPAREIYEKRRRAAAADLDARFLAAEYARTFGLEKEWKRDLGDILKLDPEHRKAREGLGFARRYGRWLTAEEAEAEKKVDEAWKAALEAKATAEATVSSLQAAGVKTTLAEARKILAFAAAPTGTHRDVKLESAKVEFPTGEYSYGVPASYKPWRKNPLIVFLHGGGAGVGDGDDYFPQIWPHSGPRGYLTVCPTVLEKLDVAWNNERHENYLRAIVKEFATKYHVDEERTYLMGHSMGGFGCFFLGTRMTDLFAAISPWSGGPMGALLANLRHTPIYIIHSSGDKTVNVSGSREAAKQLASLKIYHVYIELTIDSHGVPGPEQVKAVEWLDRFKLSPQAKAKKR